MAKPEKIADTADLVRAAEWSRQVYGALRDWDMARRGRWSTWSDGAMLLTIEHGPDGRPCAQITIMAAAERIAFHTRDWEADLPQAGQSLDAAVSALRDLTRRWFAGEMALAAFYLGDVWQGALAIDPRRLEEEMAVALNWIAKQKRVDRVEVQGPDPAKDQRFGLAVNGQPLARPH